MHLVIKKLFQFEETQVLIAGVGKLIFHAFIKVIVVPVCFESFILLPNYLLGPKERFQNK